MGYRCVVLTVLYSHMWQGAPVLWPGAMSTAVVQQTKSTKSGFMASSICSKGTK